MAIPKKSPLSRAAYTRAHNRIRRRLSAEAFNNYYSCNRCGSHDSLEIHIPYCFSGIENHPGAWEILCKVCHAEEMAGGRGR